MTRTHRALVSAALFFAGTAAAQVQIGEVLQCHMMGLASLPQQGERIEFPEHGFSIVPPSGNQWCLGAREPAGVMIYGDERINTRIRARPTQEDLLHTLFLAVSAIDTGNEKIDSIADLQSLAERYFGSGGRFGLQEGRFVRDASLGAECVRADLSHIEKDNPRAAGLPLIMVLRPIVVCRHPYAVPAKVIQLGASERYLAGKKTDALLLDLRKAEIDAFVRSLVFFAPAPR